MNTEVIVSCAVTGGSEPVAHRPKTPKEIAASALDAARAGAAIVHIHVRDPETGAASLEVGHYREVVDIIRSSDVDVVLNLTTGMGMDMVVLDDDPTRAGPGSDIGPALQRMQHVEELLPEICSFDCGVYTFGENVVSITTLEMARKLARRMQELGVRPETRGLRSRQHRGLEGTAEGRADRRPAVLPALPRRVRQRPGDDRGDARDARPCCRRVRCGRPSACRAGRCRWSPRPMLAGGNVRVGLEDNLWLTKGVPATNAQLVEKAIAIIESLGARPASPGEARARLKLTKR